MPALRDLHGAEGVQARRLGAHRMPKVREALHSWAGKSWKQSAKLEYRVGETRHQTCIPRAPDRLPVLPHRAHLPLAYGSNRAR